MGAAQRSLLLSELSLGGRYRDLLPIRSRGAFQVLSARRASDGAPCVLVLPGPNGDPSLAALAFIEVERVHGLIDHPAVPRVTWRGDAGGTPMLELDCDAVADGLDVVQLLGDSGEKLPYGAADAFISGIRKALEAAHMALDPTTDAPVCLGRLSPANLLFGRDGRWFLVGFGYNFPVEKERGVIDGSVPFYQAPELAGGGAPSPLGDYVALILFMRSVLAWIDLSGAVGRVLRGQLRPSDLELIQWLRWTETRVVGEVPALRASWAEAMEVAEKIRVCVGEALDPDGFSAFVAQLLARAEEIAPLTLVLDDPSRGSGPLDLVLGPDASWIVAADGTHQRLGRSLRRLLAALVERHEASPDKALSVWDLLEAGWPGEQPILEAGANRVYVTLARLRALGLRDAIERFDDGYRLAPQCVVRRVA